MSRRKQLVSIGLLLVISIGCYAISRAIYMSQREPFRFIPNNAHMVKFERHFHQRAARRYYKVVFSFPADVNTVCLNAYEEFGIQGKDRESWNSDEKLRLYSVRPYHKNYPDNLTVTVFGDHRVSEDSSSYRRIEWIRDPNTVSVILQWVERRRNFWREIREFLW